MRDKRREAGEEEEEEEEWDAHDSTDRNLADSSLHLADPHFDDDPETMENEKHPSRPSRYFYLLTFLSGLGGFLFGYDTGIVSGAQLLFVDDFGVNDTQLSGIVSGTVAGSIVGSLLTYPINKRFGRKPTVLIAAFLCGVAAIMLAVAPSWHMLLAGRVVIGLGVGFESATVPMYIAETAPVHMRGKLTVSNSILLTGGQFIAGVIAGIFSNTPEGWRWMFGLGAVPAAVQFFGFLMMPESPRWLMGQDRKDEAEISLRQLRGRKHAIHHEMRELEEDAATQLQDREGSGAPSVWQVLRERPGVRRALVLGCATQLFQQFGGINTVMYYCGTIITFAGVSESRSVNIWLAAGVAFFNAAFTGVAYLLVERLGRRKLFLISQVGVVLSLLLLSLAFYLGSCTYTELGPYPTQPPPTTFDPCLLHTDCVACTTNHLCGFCPNPTAYGTQFGQSACFTNNATWSAVCSMPAAVCPNPYGWLAVLALVLYLVFFAPGLGTMPWILNAEIYPLEFRHTGNAAATAVNWSANLVVSFTFLYLVNAFTTQGAFLFYACITLVGLGYIYLTLPETMGLDFEAISKKFDAGWIQAPIPCRPRTRRG